MYTKYTSGDAEEGRMTTPTPERKERVIHARVPESLDGEIRRRATNLGLSVSNLVRNVLQNTFGLVEDIVQDSAELARSARARARAGRAAPVLGWQIAVLNLNAVCESCNAILPKGTRVGIGVIERYGSRPVRCEKCLEELLHAHGRSE
jgi:hypothetical protein